MNEYRQLEMQKQVGSRGVEHTYFEGTTLKNPLQYEIGEKIVFKIRVKRNGEHLDIPYISYSLISEDGQNNEGYIHKADDGWFYIEASISKNGFVYVEAKACDENKEPIEGIELYKGSAGADVDNIFCSTKTPDDYHEFWDKLIKEAEATEPEVLFCKKIDNELYPDFEMFDMRIKAPWKDYVSVCVAYPKGAEKNSLQFAMYFQGYGVAEVGPVPLKDYFTVFVCAHAIPNNQPREFYEDLRDNKLKGYGFDAEENKRPGTTYWAKMLLRDIQALLFFKDHELLNKKDYYFIGSSQGGMQACNLASHFDRATAVILNVPWLSDICGHEISGRKENKMPKGDGVAYFDTAVAAQFLKCPAYIISGLGDFTCCGSGQMALFNNIKSPKYIEFYQNKVHSYTIPRDGYMYSLGDVSLADKFDEHTGQYYNVD